MGLGIVASFFPRTPPHLWISHIFLFKLRYAAANQSFVYPTTIEIARKKVYSFFCNSRLV